MEVVRVAVDASSAQLGGGLTYLRELLPRLAARDDIYVTALLARASVLQQDWARHAGRVRVARRRAAGLSPAWLAEVRRGADVLFAPTEIGVAPPGVPLVLMLRSAVYDASVRRESTPLRRAHVLGRAGMARVLGRRASRHIAVSRFAAGVGTRALAIPPERITVVYHGGPPAAPRDVEVPVRRGSATRLLFVSNVSGPFKNVVRLAEAVSGLRGDWTLDVAGRIDPPYRRAVDAHLARYRAHRRVRFHGECTAAELAVLYAGADWLVWPSYGETFGHPLVEAHRAGVGLLVADASSNPEIVGAAGTYFPPLDVAQMRDCLQSAVDGELPAPPPLPREYSWAHCADETAALLRQVATCR